MPRITTHCSSGAKGQPAADADIPVFMSQLTCACAETVAQAEAPMALALFRRVEMMQQSPILAAREMGLGSGDADYLLTGLREDVAQDLVLVLGPKQPPARAAGKTRDPEEGNQP